MSQAGSAETGIDASREKTTGDKVADRLALAASPTFAIMALLTATQGSAQAEIRSSAAHASPLSGMVTMYLLMTVLHAGPWLKLTFSRRRDTRSV